MLSCLLTCRSAVSALHATTSPALTFSIFAPLLPWNPSPSPRLTSHHPHHFLYRWQQRSPLPHVQINTSPSADVFNTLPSVPPLGFLSSLWLFPCWQRVLLPLTLPSPPHYFCRCARQSPKSPTTSSLDPNDQKKKFISWIDFVRDFLLLVLAFDSRLLIFNLGLESFRVELSPPATLEVTVFANISGSFFKNS